MKAFFALFALFIAASAHAKDEKILDCNFNFGTLSQIQVFQSGNELSYRVLTFSGSWQKPLPLNAEEWRAHDIHFSFRGDYYHFYSSRGTQWSYEVSSGPGRSPTIVGAADCD